MQVGNPVRTYFPPDDATSRKNLLYCRIYDGLDMADGKPTQTEKKVGAIASWLFVVISLHVLLLLRRDKNIVNTLLESCKGDF